MEILGPRIKGIYETAKGVVEIKNMVDSRMSLPEQDGRLLLKGLAAAAIVGLAMDVLDRKIHPAKYQTKK